MMSEPACEFVTLGAHVGGKDAHDATKQHVLDLRRSLAKYCQGKYGSKLEEIALVLRIDGSIQAWMRSGVDHLDIKGRSLYATADIYVPREAWENQDVKSLRSLLAAEVTRAIYAIVLHTLNRGVYIAADELKSDVAAAIEEYLSSFLPNG